MIFLTTNKVKTHIYLNWRITLKKFSLNWTNSSSQNRNKLINPFLALLARWHICVVRGTKIVEIFLLRSEWSSSFLKKVNRFYYFISFFWNVADLLFESSSSFVTFDLKSTFLFDKMCIEGRIINKSHQHLTWFVNMFVYAKNYNHYRVTNIVILKDRTLEYFHYHSFFLCFTDNFSSLLPLFVYLLPHSFSLAPSFMFYFVFSLSLVIRTWSFSISIIWLFIYFWINYFPFNCCCLECRNMSFLLSCLI